MDPNLFVWTTDWHVVSDDTEHQGIGETHPTDAAAVSAYIASLGPAGCIDTGDCKDSYGSSTGDEQDNYVTNVRATLPYAKVLAAPNALYPILPGNHDEIRDEGDAGSNDFSLFDARFWGSPYHWACDWAAPRIRFIAFHAYITHAPDAKEGFFTADQSEIDYVTAQLAALPNPTWQAIVCCHPPIAPAFGNYIHETLGGTNLQALLAANTSKIACVLGGHRHLNMQSTVLSGITHFSGPGMAYTLGNAYGGFVPITYSPAARTLSFDYLYGPPHPGGYTRYSGYTPAVIQLPALVNVGPSR